MKFDINKLYVSKDFTLTVNAVNDAPIVSQPLEDISLLEDSEAATMVLSSAFTDVDGDSLAYDVNINSSDIISAELFFSVFLLFFNKSSILEFVLSSNMPLKSEIFDSVTKSGRLSITILSRLENISAIDFLVTEGTSRSSKKDPEV